MTARECHSEISGTRSAAGRWALDRAGSAAQVNRLMVEFLVSEFAASDVCPWAIVREYLREVWRLSPRCIW
jgi:hypothetical protein